MIMFSVKSISQDLLNRLFSSNVVPRIELSHDEEFTPNYTAAELDDIRQITESKATVVGIDIYRYSQYPTEKQIFIPHLYDVIYGETWNLIKQNYSFLFQEYGDVTDLNSDQHIKHKAYFISTGDGGYQILPTPVHGIIFILTFATVLRLYNADRFMRKLHAKIGNIEVRYAMTLEEVYRYRDNFFGAGIINNAGILGRDKLNRFLIDQNVHGWFLKRTLGIENLMSLSLEDLKNLPEFAAYDDAKLHTGNNALILNRSDELSKEGFKSLEVQKIGKVRQKQTLLDIYNVHMQALIHYQNLFKQEAILTVSVGNLNTVGIGNDEA
jgi:hypothetical protein